MLVLERFGSRCETDPRGTDCGPIGSAPVNKGRLNYVDRWAGRGGFGRNMLQEHGIESLIFGGSFPYEDVRDCKVADEWFEQKYRKKLAAKDFESITMYRFDPKFETGGTSGVDYATIKGV